MENPIGPGSKFRLKESGFFGYEGEVFELTEIDCLTVVDYWGWNPTNRHSKGVCMSNGKELTSYFERIV